MHCLGEQALAGIREPLSSASALSQHPSSVTIITHTPGWPLHMPCREKEPAGEEQRCQLAASHSSTILDHVQRQVQAELRAREGEYRAARGAAGGGGEGEGEGEGREDGVAYKWDDSELWRRLKACLKAGKPHAGGRGKMTHECSVHVTMRSTIQCFQRPALRRKEEAVCCEERRRLTLNHGHQGHRHSSQAEQ